MKYKFNTRVKIIKPGFYEGAFGRVRSVDEFIGPDSPRYKVVMISASGLQAVADFSESDLEAD